MAVIAPCFEKADDAETIFPQLRYGFVMKNERNVWRLLSRPDGAIDPNDLELTTEPIPELQDGQVLVAIDYLSLDPTNRIWMSDDEQYMPPVELNEPMRGGIAGTVIKSHDPNLPVGVTVSGLGEWASHIVTSSPFVAPLDVPKGMPIETVFGSLGGTGWTAYCGFLDICRPKAGEILVVSAAAGAVGSIVGQIGKIKGCKVIGIAGGSEKCRYVVDELGFDHCIDYRNQDVGAALDALCPDGVDMNFENVGGEIMEVVTGRLRQFGRMALCGMISTYNDDNADLVTNPWPNILMRRLTIRGFIVSDYVDEFEDATKDLSQWWKEGKIKTREDVRHGLENALISLNDLYTGGNKGKLLLKVSG